MSSPVSKDLESLEVHVEDSSSSKIFMIQAEESVSDYVLMHKRQEIDATVVPVSQNDELVKSGVEFVQNASNAAMKRDFMHQNMTKTEDLDPEGAGHSNHEKSFSKDYHIPNPAVSGERLARYAGELSATEGSDTSLTDTHDERNILLDQQMDSMNISRNISPQIIAAHNDHKRDSEASSPKGGAYFYYDTPLHEETGIWIPVSVPPMTEREHEEWTRGFCSNGGYIPEDDLDWSQSIEEDKELTMWDVVLEMLLVARGKVTALASGDIGDMSWISPNLIEQSWKEMAQTLTEANFSNTQEILESGPPRWLPDSAASSCMLCSVRFHPVMCTRHHCRFCGGIFCGECSKGRSLLPEKFRTADPQRVCDVCGVRLESVQPYLMDKVSRAAQLPTHDLTDLSTLRSWVNFPWGQSMENEIYKATNTIRGYAQVGTLRPEKRIPEAILRNAKGLAFLTVVKVGMVVTYNIGTGLVVARKEDGSWSPPSTISSFGAGWGAQAGGELTDFIIVLRTDDAVKNFCSDAHFSIGAGLSAAVGIIGRTAEADMRAGPSGFVACYTYSCSKGAFIGCSLEGSVVTTRTRENSRFYGNHSINALEIVLGSLPRPPAAATLYRALGELYLQLES